MLGAVANGAVAGEQLVRVIPGQTTGQVTEVMDVQRDVVAAGFGAIIGLATPAIAFEDFEALALPTTVCQQCGVGHQMARSMEHRTGGLVVEGWRPCLDTPNR